MTNLPAVPKLSESAIEYFLQIVTPDDYTGDVHDFAVVNVQDRIIDITNVERLKTHPYSYPLGCYWVHLLGRTDVQIGWKFNNADQSFSEN